MTTNDCESNGLVSSTSHRYGRIRVLPPTDREPSRLAAASMADPPRNPRGSHYLLTRLTCLAAALCFAWSLTAAEAQFDLLAIGDWGADTPAQKAVASAMADYVTRDGVSLDAVLLLGDNFYCDLNGVTDRAWKTLFEDMYDPKRLAAPFYAVLGNHDHEQGKAEIEMEYTRKNPGSRFKMPHYWYRVDLPATQPLVTLIGLSSDVKKLGKERWEEQLRWLKAELAKGRTAKWLICFAHHPLYSDSDHGDEDPLRKMWGPLFKQHKVDFYLAGHDHTLQHLEMPGWPVSFIVSGAGGRDADKIDKKQRARFARGDHGFVHLALTPEHARVNFLDERGARLHTFERYPQGATSSVPHVASTSSPPKERGVGTGQSVEGRGKSGGLTSHLTPYEAENAVVSGAVVDNKHPGHSGTGFVDYVNVTGDYVEWAIDAAAAGTHTLEFRYAQKADKKGDKDRPLELRVNGKVVNRRLSFPPTGEDWTDWATLRHEATLVPGKNTIRLTAIGFSGPNLDCLRFEFAEGKTSAAPSNEAENQEADGTDSGSLRSGAAAAVSSLNEGAN